MLDTFIVMFYFCTYETVNDAGFFFFLILVWYYFWNKNASLTSKHTTKVDILLYETEGPRL